MCCSAVTLVGVLLSAEPTDYLCHIQVFLCFGSLIPSADTNKIIPTLLTWHFQDNDRSPNEQASPSSFCPAEHLTVHVCGGKKRKRQMLKANANCNKAKHVFKEHLFTTHSFKKVLTGLQNSCSSQWKDTVKPLALTLTRMSFRDFPLWYDRRGGSLKILLYCGWFCIKCYFSNLSNAGCCCVTKGRIHNYFLLCRSVFILKQCFL